MKITIERNELLRALAHVASVVEKRTTIPILSNVLIRARDGVAVVKGMDLDREVAESVAADIAEPGACTVQAGLIHDIVKKLPGDGKITLASAGDGERIQLTCGKSKFQLPSMAADDFPDLGAGVMAREFDIPAHDLRRLFEKSRFAVSTDGSRSYLCGVYLHAAQSDDGEVVLRAVATDGHQLARIQCALPAGGDGMPGVIIHAKTAGEIVKLIDGYGGDVHIGLSQTRIQFTVPGVVLTSKLIDGTFPDYQRIIPKGNDHILNVDNADFARAVTLVATVVTEAGRKVRIAIGDGSRMVLSGGGKDGGIASEEIPADYEGTPMEVAFNSGFMTDVSAQIEGEMVRLELSTPHAPIVVVDSGDENALYLIMPMGI